MALTASLPEIDPGERRDSDRRAIGRASTLRDAGAAPHAVTVHDLSADGCLIEHAAPLAPGDRFQIGLPGVGRRAAVVVRAADGRYGCRFDAPLGAGALAGAFVGDPVVAADFGALPVPVGPYPEPAVAPWHPATRLGLLLGTAGLFWTAIFSLI